MDDNKVPHKISFSLAWHRFLSTNEIFVNSILNFTVCSSIIYIGGGATFFVSRDSYIDVCGTFSTFKEVAYRFDISMFTFMKSDYKSWFVEQLASVNYRSNTYSSW